MAADSDKQAQEPEAEAQTAAGSADDGDQTAENAAEESASAPQASDEAPAEKPKPAAKAKPAAAEDEEDEEEPEPEPTPETCRGLVIALDTFEEAVLDGEFDGTDYMFYLEPAGVMNADLVCARAYPAESVRGGILMTRAAWKAKTIFFDDGINPERYELSFPKEFGYVKSVQHYKPESREHAKYPFSKKY